MKRAILLALTCLVLVLTTRAKASESGPVQSLLGLFAYHATPAPRCRVRAACTAEEQAERDDFARTRLEAAKAIVEVAYDPAEASLFPRSSRGRARTAALLGAIAAHETGLQPRLVRGECRPHECDGGEAVGTMQLHPGKFGLRLTAAGIQVCPAAADDCVGRAELLADPVLTMRAALHLLRAGGLSHYTGEGDQEGDVSEEIREWAAGWMAAHPARPDTEVMEALDEDAGVH